MYVSGNRYSWKCSAIIAGFITFTKYIKGKFCNTAPSVSLFKVPNDESPAVYVYKVPSIMVRNNLHVFVNKHGLPDLGVYQVIILAGIISFINYFIFTFDFYLSSFNNIFQHENDK